MLDPCCEGFGHMLLQGKLATCYSMFIHCNFTGPALVHYEYSSTILTLNKCCTGTPSQPPLEALSMKYSQAVADILSHQVATAFCSTPTACILLLETQVSRPRYSRSYLTNSRCTWPAKHCCLPPGSDDRSSLIYIASRHQGMLQCA